MRAIRQGIDHLGLSRQLAQKPLGRKATAQLTGDTVLTGNYVDQQFLKKKLSPNPTIYGFQWRHGHGGRDEVRSRNRTAWSF